MEEQEHAEQYAISVPEAARRLSISVRHAWNLVYKDELPTVHFGRSVRVPVPALIQMLSPPQESEEPGLPGSKALREGPDDEKGI